MTSSRPAPFRIRCTLGGLGRPSYNATAVSYLLWDPYPELKWGLWKQIVFSRNFNHQISLFDRETKFRARDKIYANLRYGDALAEAEEIRVNISGSFKASLQQALSQLTQYQIDNEAESFEVVKEELVHDDDDFYNLYTDTLNLYINYV